MKLDIKEEWLNDGFEFTVIKTKHNGIMLTVKLYNSESVSVSPRHYITSYDVIFINKILERLISVVKEDIKRTDDIYKAEYNPLVKKFHKENELKDILRQHEFKKDWFDKEVKQMLTKKVSELTESIITNMEDYYEKDNN